MVFKVFSSGNKIINELWLISSEQQSASQEDSVLKSSEFVLSFLLFIPFSSGKHNCLHAKSRYKQGKVLYKL